MSSKLAQYSLRERRKLAKLLGPVIRQYGSQDVHRTALEYSISLMELHLEHEPEDDFIAFVISDYYHRLHELGNSLEFALKAYAIDPLNPRNPYVVATVYNTLSTARLLDNPDKLEDAQRIGLPTEWLHQYQQDLSSLELSVEQAAELAIIYFRKTLECDLTVKEQELVEYPYKVLLNSFPQFNTEYEPTEVDHMRSWELGEELSRSPSQKIIKRVAIASIVILSIVAWVGFNIVGTSNPNSADSFNSNGVNLSRDQQVDKIAVETTNYSNFGQVHSDLGGAQQALEYFEEELLKYQHLGRCRKIVIHEGTRNHTRIGFIRVSSCAFVDHYFFGNV